ncbi:hypothetical protein OEA41_003370 [Lepraria neglecta]|uniref:Coupling of ubiquitin conjugation to ER degradation protein 1 n=1 Tax=Lepraria neglecta TaxID=209136 RepID=A0AAD9Z4J4_9LECA|nr:hypothetical protein OEA41_003370 [Lepraria neglecta]
MSDQQQTLSIPSLLLLAAFTALTIRYFFFTKPSTTTPRANPRGANPADVEQVVTMFPQIGRREIIWDLQRNGGSIAATTERILARGGLDAPPLSFQPPIPASATPSTAGTSPGQMKPAHVDLITRYNLSSKISSPLSTPSDGTGTGSQRGSQTQTWSNNKNERQALLQRRREEMILNARKKLEEKERQQLGQRT